MRTSNISIAALLLAVSLAGVPVPVAAVEICDEQFKRCEQDCSREKIAWLFKGKAYDQCASVCETRRTACEAKDLDVDRFEVILPRSHYRDAEDAEDAEKDSREMPAPEDREEKQPR